MLAKLRSATTYGITATLVEVEINTVQGVPRIEIVGLPDSAVKESSERVFAAIKNSEFKYPNFRITVNLAPADIRKEGSAFDLPIALGILAASEQITFTDSEQYMVLGELALDGIIRPIRGALVVAYEARTLGIKGLILPRENAPEAALVEGVEVYPVGTLAEAAKFLSNHKTRPAPYTVDVHEVFSQHRHYATDFNDVKGQENVKRSLEVAAAGGHNVILIGPPGSGKTMLAKRLPTIMPPLTFEEALETTKIHSVAGLLPSNEAIVATRPFRSPHHTISDSALVGGGTVPRPGEISLAHHGILFLDELPEFPRNVLEVMRQPLEDGKITISRSKMSIDYPANVMLISALNPCPCGNYGSSSQECSCTPIQIQKYMGKISGPLLDRIDIHVEVPAVKYNELSSKKNGESSETIRERVVKAREIQRRRFTGKHGMFCNADMESKEIKEFCQIDEAGANLLKTAMNKLGLSARAYDRILKVARTIADLANSENIRPEHLGEAIQYRSLDRSFYNL